MTPSLENLLLVMAVGIVVLAVPYRMPLTLAWSTPGAALLAGAAVDGAVWSAAVGTFLLVAALTALTGWWPWLSRTLAAIPLSVANAMLAGVLLPICVTAFATLGRTPGYAAPILLTWLLGYAFARRWAVPLALLAALVVVGLTLDATPDAATLVPRLDWTAPSSGTFYLRLSEYNTDEDIDLYFVGMGLLP